MFLGCAFLPEGGGGRGEALADRVSTIAVEGGSLVSRGGHVELGFGHDDRFYSVLKSDCVLSVSCKNGHRLGEKSAARSSWRRLRRALADEPVEQPKRRVMQKNGVDCGATITCLWVLKFQMQVFKRSQIQTL